MNTVLSNPKETFFSRMIIAGIEVTNVEHRLKELMKQHSYDVWFGLCFAVANMLYLESPAGVGFSYSANSSFYEYVDDIITGIYVIRRAGNS